VRDTGRHWNDWGLWGCNWRRWTEKVRREWKRGSGWLRRWGSGGSMRLKRRDYEGERLLARKF